MNDTLKDDIVRYLKLLVFLRNDEVDSTRVNRIINTLLNQPVIPLIQNSNEIIQRCEDEIIKIGYIRQAQGVTKSSETQVSYNKRKYNFNNVFEEQDGSLLITEIYNFITKRIIAEINTCVINFGYSGSGKTHLMKQLIERLEPKSYSLYEIYNNVKYIYKNNIKVKSNDIAPVFMCVDIINVLDNFTKKENNSLNKHSSRSHTILELHYDRCKVILIDLAGNEKIINSKLKDETKYINLSLYNFTRFLKLGNKYKDSKCVLLAAIKGIKNIVLNVIFHDNSLSNSSNHLMVLKDLL